MSTVWIFYTFSLDVILRGKPVLASQKGRMFSQATFSYAPVICQAVVFP